MCFFFLFFFLCVCFGLGVFIGLKSTVVVLIEFDRGEKVVSLNAKVTITPQRQLNLDLAR